MERVDKLIERIEASTDPFEAKLGNKYAYVKIFGSRWSNKVLINEYICLNIAKHLGLTIPNGGICLIDDNTDKDDVIDYIDYTEDIKGIAFYSEKIYNVNPASSDIEVINNIINKEEINSIILFDHLIYNIDRHNGNLLLHYGSNIAGFKMYIIDHSHVFNMQHNWNCEGLQELIDKGDYKDKKILDLNYNEIYKYFHQLNILNEELLRKAAENFKIIINEDLLDGIIESIPKVWIYKEEDILKLKEYILYRLSNIDYMVEMILSYEKFSGGI